MGRDSAFAGPFPGVDARLLVENASDLFAVADAQGTLRYVSPSVERMFGRTVAEMVGRSAFDFVCTEDLPAVFEGFARAAGADGPDPRVVVRCYHADGSIRVIEAVGKGVRDAAGAALVICCARDVTEARRTAEESARKSEELRALFLALPDLCFRLDADGRIIDYNAPRRSDLYVPPEAFLGKCFREVLPEGVARALDDCISGAHRTGAVSTVEYTLPMPAGIRHFEGRCVLLPERHTLVLVRDVSERRRTEEALRRREERSRESQKMEAIGRLAGGIAHDFNNLLMAILGYGELLLRRLGPDNPLRREAIEIKKAGDRAASLTRQLLAFSRRQVLQPKVLDLNAIVLDMREMLERLIGERIELRTITAEGLGAIRADRSQLEQVLLNLVLNARDAMPDGGELVIETSHGLPEGTVPVAAGASSMPPPSDRAPASLPPTSLPPASRRARRPTHVVLTVRDTGCGMDADTRSHLFEPFFTTKERGQGTGLGLATVYGVVSQSGGRIAVESEVDRGTTFRVYLPRVDEPAEPSSSGPATPARGGSETVLVVEDDDAVRRLVVEVLEQRGYRVLAAERGDRALALLERSEVTFDLLLTDVVMPGLTGRELAARALALRPGARVLYMSGYTDDAVTSEDLDRRTELLQKPFTPETLARRVRDALDRR